MQARSRREFLSDVGCGALAAALGAGVLADLGLASPGVCRGGGGGARGAVVRRARAARAPDAGDAGQSAAADAGGEAQGGDRTAANCWRRGAGQRPHVRRRGLRRLPHDDGAGPGVSHVRRTARGPTGAAGLEGPLPQHQPHPGARRPHRRGAAPGRAGTPATRTRSKVGESIRAAVRQKDGDAAERTFAALVAGGSAEDAFNGLLVAVEDATEVHRVVLPYRAWDLLDLVGREHAHTLLRQSVRYCVKAETWVGQSAWNQPRALLPKLLEEHHLLDATAGPETARWTTSAVEELSRTIFAGTPDQAAGAVAAALADGIAPAAIGEAVSLAANQLVLRDIGRTARDEVAGKPMGSVHGDSIGVHACDSANAWRNMSRVANAAQHLRLPDPRRLPGRLRPGQPRRRLPQLEAPPAGEPRRRPSRKPTPRPS